MRLTLRLLGGIWLAALAAAAGLAYLQVAEERHQLTVDLERRAGLLGEGLREALEPALARGSRPGIERLLKKLGKPDQGIAVYDKGATAWTAASGWRRRWNTCLGTGRVLGICMRSSTSTS